MEDFEPFPQAVAALHNFHQRIERDDVETCLVAKFGNASGYVWIAPTIAPASDSKIEESALVGVIGQCSPCFIVDEFVEDGHAARLESPSNIPNDFSGIAHENEHEARPGAVGNCLSEFIDNDICFDDINIGEFARAKDIQERRRAFEGDDFTFRPDNFRQVGSSKPRTRADVYQGLAAPEPSLGEACFHIGAPQFVLASEPIDLCPIGAERIIAFFHDK